MTAPDPDALAQAVDDACEDDSDDLEAIARRYPEAIRPFHRRLIEAEVWGPELFYGMDEETAAYLVQRIEAGVDDPVQELAILASSPTEAAVAAIRGWDREPPAWAGDGTRSIRRFGHFGGWELDAAGEVRPLSSPTAWALVPADDPNTRSVSGGQLNAQCGRCGTRLWRLFDVDLGTGILAGFGGPNAGRVVVGDCIPCAETEVMFTEYDDAGNCRWVADRLPADHQINGDDWDVPPGGPLIVGPARPTPISGSAWNQGGSTLGGRPDWIQDPDYPECPRCGRTMLFLGMIEAHDLWDEFAEGCTYAFVDPDCRQAAVVYQQS